LCQQSASLLILPLEWMSVMLWAAVPHVLCPAESPSSLPTLLVCPAIAACFARRSGCWGRAPSLGTARPPRRYCMVLLGGAACLGAVWLSAGCGSHLAAKRQQHRTYPLQHAPATCLPHLPALPAERRPVPHAGQRHPLPLLPLPRPGECQAPRRLIFALPARCCRFIQAAVACCDACVRE
jgi:hypothetical protein